ncbi:MAG: hypothetical protein IH944_12835 [Armatimonadetes bacterium]|nr:hypothetical protein [Armatimonadota bacterium]
MKRKVWFFVIAAPLVAVGVLLFVGARENPDYVRAAKLLPEAKQRAREVFGPLTWEEYRAEKGIVHRDDTSKWRRIERSIPDDLWDFRWLDPPEPEKYGEVFEANRAWMLGLSSETENLVFHQPYPERLFDESLIPAKNLINMLATGIIGAADVGDVDAVRQIAETAWNILEKWSEEPSTLHATMVISGVSVITEALLTAVVRNIENERLLAVAQEFIANAPTPPELRLTLAGDARSNLEFFRSLRDEGLENLNQTLNSISDVAPILAPPASSTPTLWDDVREYVSDLFNDNANTRNAGKHAFDALEGRLWEVEVDVLTYYEAVQQDPSSNRQKSKKFVDELAAKTDISYEYAQASVTALAAFRSIQHDLTRDLALLALSIISENSSVESLPEYLTDDRLFPDPFAGTNILYRKTSTGFVVYSRSDDGADGGFSNIPANLSLRQNVNITYDVLRTDYGIIVNYEIPEATAPP